MIPCKTASKGQTPPTEVEFHCVLSETYILVYGTYTTYYILCSLYGTYFTYLSQWQIAVIVGWFEKHGASRSEVAIATVCTVVVRTAEKVQDHLLSVLS